MMEISREHAYSEYLDYASTIAGMLRAASEVVAVAEYLETIRTEWMEFSRESLLDLEIARILVDLVYDPEGHCTNE